MRRAVNVIRLPGASYDLSSIGVQEALDVLMGKYQEKLRDIVLIAAEGDAFSAGHVAAELDLPVILVPGKSDQWAVAGKFHTMWSGVAS